MILLSPGVTKLLRRIKLQAFLREDRVQPLKTEIMDLDEEFHNGNLKTISDHLHVQNDDHSIPFGQNNENSLLSLIFSMTFCS